MRYPLSSLVCLLLVLGLASAAPAQTWQMPNTDLGVPKPQGPRIPTPGNLMEGQQARTRAQNQAAMDEVERYNAQQAQRDQLLDEARQDIAQIERQRREQAEFNAQFEARNKPQYEAGYQVLAEMLAGKRPASLPLAVFVVENSYAAGELSYAAFKAELDELATVCRGLAGTDTSPTARFMALHRLMTDTVQVSYAGKVVSRHLPYRYDFEDFRGEQDYRKMFVTKLLRTNTGQCHSLPLLYKMLADRLGVKTYISMAPNHTFISVKDARGGLYRYETTNGHFTTDAFYMSSGYIKAGALKQRTYLDTLTLRENLACQLVDLASGYEHYYGYDEFVKKCADLALKYYPQGMQARILAHNVALARFVKPWKAAGQPSPAVARTLPQLQPYMAEVERWNRALAEVGFEEMPKEQYDRWLNALEQEKARLASQQAAARFAPTAAK
ncbi:transglutaminase family protein [Hymenobacter daecheongensis]|nr:transglutaminase family protein [Hymenobacter daecheongensis]